MKKSKKGTWTLDDIRYKFFVNTDNGDILHIKMYQLGFNKITFMIEKSVDSDKFIEETYPLQYAKEVSFSNKESAMKYLIRLFNDRSIKLNDSLNKKLQLYKLHLFNENPELLI